MTERRIYLCRAYDARRGAVTHGARFLVDRLWPRGIAKADLPINAWPKDLTPSTALRIWFGHEPAKWAEFTTRYLAELNANPTAVELVLDWYRKGDVTLIYGAKDAQHTHALVLRDFLAAKLEQESPDA